MRSLISSSTVTQFHQILSLPTDLSHSPIISCHYQLNCHVVPSDPSLPAQLSRSSIRSSPYQLICHTVLSYPVITSSTVTQSHHILSAFCTQAYLNPICITTLSSCHLKRKLFFEVTISYDIGVSTTSWLSYLVPWQLVDCLKFECEHIRHERVHVMV